LLQVYKVLRLSAVAALFWLTPSAWAQTGCEISNTGADSGIATISATPNMGYSAPGGVGAVGFRIPTPCITTNVSYHVWRVDTSASSAPTTYDIGLYCVSGDCATGSYSGALYVHTGPIYGSWFTNSRIAATVKGAKASGFGKTITVSGSSGSFQPADFPIGGIAMLSNCGPFNGSYPVTAVSGTTSITVTSKNGVSSSSGISCNVASTTTFPSGFGSSSVCTNSSVALVCQNALPWIADGRTVCTSIPCTLPAGLYAAAIGTTCSDALKPVTCAQLLGDADRGLIYPFTASSTSYDAGGLPSNMNFTVSSTTAVWNTTQGPSAPIKPVKLLIY
jgi:hypothetical protein